MLELEPVLPTQCYSKTGATHLKVRQPMIARREVARRVPASLEAWEAGAGQAGQSGRRAASVATATARRYGGAEGWWDGGPTENWRTGEDTRSGGLCKRFPIATTFAKTLE